MKKLSIALLFVSSLVITSCHYGQDEAGATLDRNELYKGDNKDYSVNRAGEGGKMNAEKAPETTETKDSTASAPAEHGK